MWEILDEARNPPGLTMVKARARACPVSLLRPDFDGSDFDAHPYPAVGQSVERIMRSNTNLCWERRWRPGPGFCKPVYEMKRHML